VSGRRASSLSPSEVFILRQWGATLRACFGEMPYLVGSVERGEAWRDVDIRIMLREGDPLLADADRWPRHSGRMTALNVAISVWGQHVTGLPIDFQFQERVAANDEYGDQPRNPIGMGTQSGDSDRDVRENTE